MKHGSIEDEELSDAPMSPARLPDVRKLPQVGQGCLD
jgi:hypothetical protein